MSLKTIKVNPIFLSGGSSSSNNKTRKEKPVVTSLGHSNNVKKKLIARIKNFQQGTPSASNTSNTSNASNASHTSHDIPIMTDPFSDSVQFLDNLARDREDVKRNKTLKKKQAPNPMAYMDIATELPSELDWNIIAPTLAPPTLAAHTLAAPTLAAPTLAAPTLAAHTLAPHMPQMPRQSQPWNAPPAPSYSNLKNGGKPTYRTWLRNTQKNKPVVKPPPAISILGNIAPAREAATTSASASEAVSAVAVASEAVASEAVASEAATASEAVASEAVASEAAAPNTDAPAPFYAGAPAPPPPKVSKRKRITRTLKYKLGKHANGKVSVLIKNAQTRRKVQTEQALLKQKSILEIKNFLRGKNLLKVGSEAPNDVLRQLYEQSILAGQVENKSKETLIHNYFNAEK